MSEGTLLLSPRVGDQPEEGGIATVLAILKSFAAKVKALPPLRLLFIMVLILLVTAGNAMQIIGLNFWLRRYPASYADHAGSFTTLAVSGLLFGAFFFILLVVYIITKRPCLKFAMNPRGILLLCGIGLMDTVNSAMSIYAANYCPEVLQALFTSLMPIYTCVFSKYALSDQRKYLNPWIGVAFGLMIIGVIVASAKEFTGTGSTNIWWSVIFFLSIPPTSLMNVWQTKYMLDYTKVRHHEDEHLANGEVGTPTKQLQHHENVVSGRETCTEASHHHHHRGEDSIVKLVMLFGDTFSQFVFIMAILPMDALPFWGGSPGSVSGAWDNFSGGISCLFNCSENFLFCCVYSAGFVFTYIGGAYLNQYSATLCCMIGQLSSPATALILIIAPSWNLSQGSTPWYLSVVAIIMLAVGTLVYSMWEELTSDQAPDAVLAGEEQEAPSAFSLKESA